MSVTLEPVRGSGAGNLDFRGSGILRMNDGVLANLSVRKLRVELLTYSEAREWSEPFSSS